MSDQIWQIHAIARAQEKPDLPAPVRQLVAGNLAAILSPFNAELGLEDAIAHHSTLSALAITVDLLPFRLGTAVACLQEARDLLVHGGARYRRMLAEVSGCLEFGLVLTQSRIDEPVENLPPTPRSGRGYLRERGAARDGRRKRQDMQRHTASACLETIARHSRRWVDRPVGASPHHVGRLREIALLVPREHESSLRAAVKNETTRLGSVGLETRLMGPWPCYSFVAAGPEIGTGAAA